MRCHAYQLPSEVYRELEAQILEALGSADREQLSYLLSEYDLKIELLSGEWRVLFGDTEDDYYQVVSLDPESRRARMAVSPDEIAGFVELLRDPARREAWQPISFGVAELVDALPVGVDLVGLVFLEEDEDWLWSENSHEIVAIRPEVYAMIEPHMRRLLEAQDHAAAARLATDHCEGSIEFSEQRWFALGQAILERASELIPVIESSLSSPDLYTQVREGLDLVADPRGQPCLDAWLRVHSQGHQYALYFRDIRKEKG